MLKIDRIDDENIRIQQDSFNVVVAPVFFAAAGAGGIVTISPKSAGAYRSFSDTLKNVEINGVNGSEYAPEEAAHELNSFVGNFRKGGTSSSNNGNWIRPKDRPEIPKFVNGEQSVYFLMGLIEFGINEHSINSYLVSTNGDFSGGTFTIDWGDGTNDTLPSNTSIPPHKYDYYGLDLPVSSEGYKWVWIKITPNNGDLTLISMFAPTSVKTLNHIPQIFEMYLQASELTVLDFAYGGMKYENLDVFWYEGTNKITNMNYFLSSCVNLKRLKLYTGNSTSFNQFLSSCFSLNQDLEFDTSKGTDFYYFMSSCKSFDSELKIDTSNGTDFRGFLYDGSAFNKQLTIDTSKGLYFDMFMIGCNCYNRSLTIDLLSTTVPLGQYLMFSQNISLTKPRVLNMSSVHNILSVANSSVNIDSLMLLYEDLPDRTGLAAGNFDIHNTPANSVITSDQIALFTSKNWTLQLI